MAQGFSRRCSYICLSVSATSRPSVRPSVNERSISRADWTKGVVGAVGSAVFGVAVPNMVMRDRNSPYAFTAKQMGPYDIEAIEPA